MSFIVRPLTEGDIDAIVSVHMAAFPNFFLTFLGPRFLREFYFSFLCDEAGVGFTAVEAVSEKIVGVIVGPVRPHGYFKRLLKRRWWSFCLASIGAVTRRPSTLKRLLRAVFYRGEAPLGPDRALLSSIAVCPSMQKSGVGRALLDAWLGAVRKRGASGAFLTTDAENNDYVNSFYRRCGWVLESTFETPECRKMKRYVYDFNPIGDSDV